MAKHGTRMESFAVRPMRTGANAPAALLSISADHHERLVQGVRADRDDLTGAKATSQFAHRRFGAAA